MNHNEDEFYKKCRENDVNVSVYLLNGIAIRGTLGQSDGETIIVKGLENILIYKHAIMSIVPNGVGDV